MNLRLSTYAVCTVFAVQIGAASLSAFSATREHSQASASQADSAQRPASTEQAGTTKFKQNCARCHEAPQSFSPRISGTILRHMRVRASLSAQDERDILRFLNP